MNVCMRWKNWIKETLCVHYTVHCVMFPEKMMKKGTRENTQLLKFTQREICKPIGYKYWNVVLKNEKKISHKYISYYESTYKRIYVKCRDGMRSLPLFPQLSLIFFAFVFKIPTSISSCLAWDNLQGGEKATGSAHTCIQSRMASSLTWLCFLIITRIAGALMKKSSDKPEQREYKTVKQKGNTRGRIKRSLFANTTVRYMTLFSTLHCVSNFTILALLLLATLPISIFVIIWSEDKFVGI